MKTLLCLAGLFAVALADLAPADARQDKPAAPKVPVFDAPKGWEREKPSAFAAHRFRVGKGDQTASVTVSELRKDRFEVAPNVNRWLAQVGQAPLEEAAARRLVGPVEVGG